MSQSRTKQAILERHQTNPLLQAGDLGFSSHETNDLSAPYPFQQPSEQVFERAATALESGQTHYVDVAGIGELREAVATFLNESGLHAYHKENVLITAGLQEARFLSIQKIGEQFGMMGLPAIVDPGVRQAAGVRPLAIRELPCDEANGFLPTVDGIRAALEAGVRLLYLESPSRLTGASFSAADAQQITELLETHDAALILDQGLAPLAPEATSLLATGPDALQRVAVLGELWPGAGLESWFIGYIGAQAEWLERIQSQKQIMAICTSTATQFAALATADEYGDIQEDQQRRLAALRDQATALATERGVQSIEGTVASFVALAVDETAAATLRAQGFQVADGAVFGRPDVIRISVNDGTQLEELITHLAPDQLEDENGRQ